ncbi:MAG: hypothetical protein ACXABV_04315 [Candidatus Thorarchaeota archaeon]|jgi:hypothetical protein
MGYTDMSAVPLSKEAHNPFIIPTNLVTCLMGAVAVLMPYIVQISGTGPDTDMTVAAVTWMYQESSYNTGFRIFIPEEWLFSIPVSIPRLLFAYQMRRYYQERTSHVNTVLVGVFSEMPVPLIMAALFLANLSTPVPIFLPTVVPVPILIAVGLILMWRHPKSLPTTPWE